MNTRILAAAALAMAAVLFAQPANAQRPTGWYLGLGGGYGMMNYTFAWTPGPTIDSDTAWSLGASGALG